jgi:hypothetical protein
MKKLIAILLCAPVMANAAFISGNDLLKNMNDTSIGIRMHSLGFVVGVHDAFEGDLICAGSNVTAGQLRDVVHKFLTENPAQRNQSAVVLSAAALSIAFPCAAKPKGRGA